MSGVVGPTGESSVRPGLTRLSPEYDDIARTIAPPGRRSLPRRTEGPDGVPHTRVDVDLDEAQIPLINPIIN